MICLRVNRKAVVLSVLASINLNLYAAQVYATDVIVKSSLGVGTGCSSSESFGFDTIRLKEDNLRIHFDDASTSGSFPANDWRITINDSSNGGSEYFSIDDATAGKQVFRVDAGAQANAIRVDKNGDVGMGIADPVMELHVYDDDTPTLRLQQNGGYGQSIWDIAGNEVNFFVRDAKNGSKLPFKIQPGAENNCVTIHNDDYVGIGLSTGSGFPDAKAKLHIGVESGSNDGVLIGPAGTSSNSATLHVVGTAMITGAAYIGGTLEIASSRALKENIEAVSADDAMQAFKGLKPVHYNYIGDDEGQLGFIAEDVPTLVANKERRSLSPMDFTALLTKVTQEQQHTIELQQMMILELSERLAKLEQQAGE